MVFCVRLDSGLTYCTTDTNVTQRAEGGRGEEGPLGPHVAVSLPPDSVAEGESDGPSQRQQGLRNSLACFQEKKRAQ